MKTSGKPAIRLKRAYERPASSDGRRFLVERLWPRGVKKNELRLTDWLKDVAPSAGLRTWFSHDPEKWDEFRRCYFAELDAGKDAWTPLLKAAQAHDITLVYSSRDQEHNNAVALRQYLEAKLRRGQKKAA